MQTSLPCSNGGVTSNKVLSGSIQTHTPGVLAADKTADKEMSLVHPPRGERKFLTVCTDHVEKEINGHSSYLKLTWWKRQRHKDANPQEWDKLWLLVRAALCFHTGTARNSTGRQTVFIFQLEQFRPLFCNSFRLVKLVSALFSTPTVLQTPGCRHLETLSCLNCSDWSELSGTTKLEST